MDHQDVARQTQVEHEMLGHIMEALRTAAGWQVRGPDASRKLSTLRFVAGSFQRHLEHLLTLEECDGYLGLALPGALQARQRTLNAWPGPGLARVGVRAPTLSNSFASMAGTRTSRYSCARQPERASVRRQRLLAPDARYSAR